jgi:isoleucyl-tRNA synthetase
VTGGLEEYEPRRCTDALGEFVSDLSRWYLRTTRRRFWKNDADDDKEAAYYTLHSCLKSLIFLMAPFTPFLAEELYQNIVRSVEDGSQASVHHNPWPMVEESLLDVDLEHSMVMARRVTELGRSLRTRSGIKLRQPLNSAVVVCDADSLAGLESLVPILQGELNVSVLNLSQVEKPGYEYLQEGDLAVGIDLHIDEDLRLEGLSREIVRVIQNLRKLKGLRVDQSIVIRYSGDPEIERVMVEKADYIGRETLAFSLEKVDVDEGRKNKIQGFEIAISISPLG